LGNFLALIFAECQQFSKTLSRQWLTAQQGERRLGSPRYLAQPAMKAAVGLLADDHACCYRLDFKQLVYLFGLQWWVPETET